MSTTASAKVIDVVAPAPRQRRHRTRIAIVDRFALVTESIGRTLSRTGVYDPVPVTLSPLCSTPDARQSVIRTGADVAILSLVPGGVQDPLTLVEELSVRGMTLIVTGPMVTEECALLYRAAGALAARRQYTIAEIVALVDRVTTWGDGGHSRHRTARSSPRSYSQVVEQTWSARRLLGRLAPTEARILGHLMLGRTADDIARIHVVSVATVRSQISRMLTKLDVGSQLSAVALARLAGWEAAVA